MSIIDQIDKAVAIIPRGALFKTPFGVTHVNRTFEGELPVDPLRAGDTEAQLNMSGGAGASALLGEEWLCPRRQGGWASSQLLAA